MSASRPISEQEAAALLAAMIRPRDKLLLQLALFSGFRVWELLPLRFVDLWDPLPNAPRTELTIERRALKGGRGLLTRRRVRSRTVPLHPTVRAEIQTYVLALFSGGYPPAERVVFGSRSSHAFGAVDRHVSYPQAFRLLRAAAVAAHLDPTRLGWHSTRKSFARRIYENSSHNLTLTQKVMGHASVMTTALYLRETDEAANAAVLGLSSPAFARDGQFPVALLPPDARKAS